VLGKDVYFADKRMGFSPSQFYSPKTHFDLSEHSDSR